MEVEEEQDGGKAVSHSHLIIIVTGYYRLHVLHVFTVDSLYSVQTLDRSVYHSKGYSVMLLQRTSFSSCFLPLSVYCSQMHTVLSADPFHAANCPCVVD